LFVIQFHYRQSEVVQRLVLVAREGYAFTKDFAPRMKTLNQVNIDLLLHNVDISQIQRVIRTETKIDRNIQTQLQSKTKRESKSEDFAISMKTLNQVALTQEF
jgi:hypothetical protein